MKGLIFDVDGTLVDSNDAHARSWHEVLSRHEFYHDYERVRRCIGMGGDKLVPELTGLSEDDPIGKKMSKERGELFEKEYIPKLKAFPGAAELIELLQKKGYKLAVASSSDKLQLKTLLEIAGAESLVEESTSKDDADNSKPDPDIVAAAVKKLGLPPDQVVMIGDTPYDVAAARKAGVACWAVRCGGWTDEELQGAEKIFDSPQDIISFFSTPAPT